MLPMELLTTPTLREPGPMAGEARIEAPEDDLRLCKDAEVWWGCV